MVRRYRGSDNASTTLNGSVDNSTTSWTTANASVFGSEGDFFLICESEIVKGTAISGNTITVERAQCGTTAASHTTGATVRSIITKEDIEGRLNENNMLRTLAYGRIVTANGTVLTSSDFTLSNGGNSILAGKDGVICLTSKAHTSDDVTGIVRTFTVNTNFNVYAHVQTSHFDADPMSGVTANRAFGIMSRSTSGGSMRGIMLYPGKYIAAQERASFISTPTTSAIHGATGRAHVWFRIKMRWNVGGTDSNDQMTVGYSYDSIHWVDMHTFSGAFSNQELGMYVSNNGQNQWSFFLDSYLEDNTV